MPTPIKPTVKLLLNGHHVPNQVIGGSESIAISAVVEPPEAERFCDLIPEAPDGFCQVGDDAGTFRLDDQHRVGTFEFGVRLVDSKGVTIACDSAQVFVLKAFKPSIVFEPKSKIGQGDTLAAQVSNVDLGSAEYPIKIRWIGVDGARVTQDPEEPTVAQVDTSRSGECKITVEMWAGDVPLYRGGDPIRSVADVMISAHPGNGSRSGPVPVALQRAQVPRTSDQALWSLIRYRTSQMGSSNYLEFVDQALCDEPAKFVNDDTISARIGQAKSYGTSSYEVLKFVTELFLLTKCGTSAEGFDPSMTEEQARLGEPVTVEVLKDRIQAYLGNSLPYLDRVIHTAFPRLGKTDKLFCGGLIKSRVESPCLIELIWSYWHEEAMLVQGANAITQRFQNIRGPGSRDPLAHVELDPLRPLNNILWGYIQDEQKRLSVQRRAYEYDHHYGLALFGEAVGRMRPADSRSKFLEAFHALLNLAFVFYKEDSDTTVIADGYPLLNALKEVHMLLAQGAHNQFGDLPWTARVEMLIQQWMFARPEMRDFLQSRPMVPYKEPWMAQVDTMKTMQGWTDVSVTHFSDLGTYGEQILLSVRYGDWTGRNDEESAKNWARYWRPEVQGYIHAYRAATGVDLTSFETIDATIPAVHLQRRLEQQQARGDGSRLRMAPGRGAPLLNRR